MRLKIHEINFKSHTFCRRLHLPLVPLRMYALLVNFPFVRTSFIIYGCPLRKQKLGWEREAKITSAKKNASLIISRKRTPTPKYELRNIISRSCHAKIPSPAQLKETNVSISLLSWALYSKVASIWFVAIWKSKVLDMTRHPWRGSFWANQIRACETFTFSTYIVFLLWGDVFV